MISDRWYLKSDTSESEIGKLQHEVGSTIFESYDQSDSGRLSYACRNFQSLVHAWQMIKRNLTHHTGNQDLGPTFRNLATK